MVDLSGESDLGRFEGVISREGDGKEEHAACIWRVALTKVVVMSDTLSWKVSLHLRDP